MLDKKAIEQILTPIEIYIAPEDTPLCPICFTPLEEDWKDDIDEDGEPYEYEIYRCPNLECDFFEAI